MNASKLLGIAAALSVTSSLYAASFEVSNHQATGPNLGLDPANTYLHKLDFPNDGTGDTVNGVTFSPAGTGNSVDPLTGNPFSLTMANALNFAGTGLLGDFIHNGSQNPGSVETMRLGGFIPGNTYDVRLYYRNFGTRPNNVSFDSDGLPGTKPTLVLDQATSSDQNYWSVVFQADTSELTIRFAQQVFNASWHQYGVTSQLIPGTAGQPVAITTPPHDTAARPGGTAIFRVGVSGSAPFGFQWRKDGVDISGATNMVYGITNASAAQTGFYEVEVRNAAGQPIVSQPAELTLGAPFDLAVDKVPVLTVAGVAGRTARVEDTPSLTNGWLTLTNVLLNGGRAVVIDRTVPARGERFYRAVEQGTQTPQ